MDKRVQQLANKRTAPRPDRGAVVENKGDCGRKLDGLSCRCAHARRRGPGKCIPARFLFWTLVDFDGTFEVGPIFDHDAGSCQVTVDRTILLNFNSILRAKDRIEIKKRSEEHTS